jgi:cell division transport system permease protein
MSSIGYAVGEALASVRRAGRSAAMSIGTIAIAFLTLGGFLLVSINLQALVDQWAAAAEISVYLRDDIPPDARSALLDELSRHGAVEAIEYVSKKDALDRFTRDFPELADVAVSTGNPFPPSIEIQLRTDVDAASTAEAIAAQIATREGVLDVQYDQQWLERLLIVIRTVRIAGLIVAGVLVLGAAFTVAAVVRLSLQARSDELEIMRLVGAPYSFIRGPAVAEGALLGAIGAIVALALLAVGASVAGSHIAAAAAEWGSTGTLRFLGIGDAVLLVVAGGLVGGLAGLVASRAA